MNKKCGNRGKYYIKNAGLNKIAVQWSIKAVA